MASQRKWLSRQLASAPWAHKVNLLIVIGLIGSLVQASSINVNFQYVQPTSPQRLTAVLGLDNGGTSSSPTPSSSSNHAKTQATTSSTNSKPTTTTSAPTTTTTASAASKVTTTPKKEHKHSNKKINVADHLHKFDLYIDPICEQVNKLTEKQLIKIYSQLRLFSHLVSL